MIFNDGISAITFDPVSQGLAVLDSTALQIARTRAVVAAPNSGLPGRRTRTITLQRNAAEIAALETLFNNVEGVSFLFTDSVGRIWTAWWLDDFARREVAPNSVSDSEYTITVSLFLDAISSSPGSPYYANADVSQMSILKSGATELFFPRSYQPPSFNPKRPTTHKALGGAFIATDPSRFSSATMKTMEFTRLSDAFVSALEDYYVDTIEGSAYPFTLAHFRDSSISYRWVGGMNFTQGLNLTWSGSIRLRKEV